MPAATTQTTPFPLRMRRELRERLEARAKKNGRSANSEIVSMVESGLNDEVDLASIPTEVLLATVVERLGASVQIVVPEDRAKKAGIAPRRR